jgi:hypothetical protein
LKFAGTISPEALLLMGQAIEAGCEQVDDRGGKRHISLRNRRHVDVDTPLIRLQLEKENQKIKYKLKNIKKWT